MLQTIAAAPRPSRRRRRPRDAGAAPVPPEVPVVRATSIRAFEPFDGPEGAAAWLGTATAAEETIDVVVDLAIALVNDALHAHAVAAADPHPAAVTAERAVAVRLGYGSGDQLAESTYGEAREVDVWATGASRRRTRQDDLRPQERVGALLRGRERADVCEPLLLRARLDLDAGRTRESALQLRPAAEALLIELSESVDDDGHRRDVAELTELLPAVQAAAETALRSDLSSERETAVAQALELSERIIRRRRILTE